MAKAPTAEARDEAKPVCGIIMPIAAMPPKYDAAHWIDVRRVIDAAIIKADMTPQIVSDSFEGDVIQRRIINNLYDNPVVVCDVSGLNPNVMFELGMRITFKQPVVIITDDYATIPFDTKVIEHLGYPRDLHIHHTTDFIEKLADRIKRLHDQKKSETFKSFIEEFGTFEVLEPTKTVVPAEQLILDRLDRIERNMRRSRADEVAIHHSFSNRPARTVEKTIRIRMKPEFDDELIEVILPEFLNVFSSAGSGEFNSKTRTFTLPIQVPPVQSSMFVSDRLMLIPSDLREMIADISTA